ncbi:MAG: histidine triad nucleotide-binding protein [Cystobacterineae bacterium]|nr:histidine triad nucleotide-binding protein [Cystobacterineae bacterium]
MADVHLECLFCKAARGDLPVKRLYEDDEVLGFADVRPQAPLHALFIPKRHIASADALTEADCALAGRLAWAAAQLARQQGHAEDGYRLVYNCNAYGGQTVFHLHLHLLAGRPLGWPPG